jgi:hypothetical protein
MIIETDESFRELVEDDERLLEMVRQARIKFLGYADIPVWSPADALAFLIAVGFEVGGQWLGQQIRRGHIVPREVGGMPFLSDAVVAGMVWKLFNARKFIAGRFLWAKTPDEVEAEARELNAFGDIVKYLSETHDSEELRRRCADALAESAREAMSDDPAAAERQKAADNAAIRYRAALLMRQGAFDDFDGMEAEPSDRDKQPA